MILPATAPVESLSLTWLTDPPPFFDMKTATDLACSLVSETFFGCLSLRRMWHIQKIPPQKLFLSKRVTGCDICSTNHRHTFLNWILYLSCSIITHHVLLSTLTPPELMIKDYLPTLDSCNPVLVA